VLIEAKDDGSGGDCWSYKMCKAPVKSSPPTNQHPVFTGRMPFLSPNQQCLIAPGYLGGGCHASHQLCDASTPTFFVDSIAGEKINTFSQHPNLTSEFNIAYSVHGSYAS